MRYGDTVERVLTVLRTGVSALYVVSYKLQEKNPFSGENGSQMRSMIVYLAASASVTTSVWPHPRMWIQRSPNSCARPIESASRNTSMRLPQMHSPERFPLHPQFEYREKVSNRALAAGFSLSFGERVGVRGNCFRYCNAAVVVPSKCAPHHFKPEVWIPEQPKQIQP